MTPAADLPSIVENATVLITIAGVPAHPLLVHAVVVLVPLAALGAVVLAVRSGWSRAYGPLVAAGAVSGALAATLAQQAGNQLLQALTIPPELEGQLAQHGQFGLYTVVASWPFAVLAMAAAVLGRRDTGSRTWARVTGALSALAGVVAVVVTVLAGHSGATAVWGYVTG